MNPSLNLYGQNVVPWRNSNPRCQVGTQPLPPRGYHDCSARAYHTRSHNLPARLSPHANTFRKQPSLAGPGRLHPRPKGHRFDTSRYFLFPSPKRIFRRSWPQDNICPAFTGVGPSGSRQNNMALAGVVPPPGLTSQRCNTSGTAANLDRCRCRTHHRSW